MKQQRHPPLTLICDSCGAEFKRRYSYHKYLVETRGIPVKFCNKICKGLAQSIKLPDTVLEEYEQGNTLAEIAHLHNVSAEHVRHKLLAMNSLIRPRFIHMLSDKNPTKGKGHTPQAIEKIREANHRQFSNPANRQLAAHNQRNVMVEGKINASSKLEDKVAQELSNLGLAFIRQYGIRDPENGRYCACVDFMLADGTAIEVNGTYWHTDIRAYPDGPKDAIQKRCMVKYQTKIEAMKRLNIRVIELWEIDLRTDMTGTIRKALSV